MLIQNRTIGTVAYLGGLHAVLEEFCWCWSQMIQFNQEYLVQPGERIFYTRAKASYHALARNELVKTMQGDWLLQIDADHEFEPDVLVRLLRAMDEFKCDVVTGLYENKNYPHPPVIYQWDDRGELRVIGDWPKEARGFAVGSCGAGTLLVKKSVFERIEQELQEEPFAIRGKWGEDHSFSLRLKQLGIVPFVATQVESYHLSVKPIKRADTALEAISLEDGQIVEGRA